MNIDLKDKDIHINLSEFMRTILRQQNKTLEDLVHPTGLSLRHLDRYLKGEISSIPEKTFGDILMALEKKYDDFIEFIERKKKNKNDSGITIMQENYGEQATVIGSIGTANININETNKEPT